MFFWITTIGALVFLAGVVIWRRGRAIRLLARTEVLAMWRALFPAQVPISAVLEPSGTAALIDLENGGTGLLWLRGKKVEGRVLKAGRFQEIGENLGLDLPDVDGFIVIEITQPLVRRIWVETLKTVLEEFRDAPEA